MDDSEATTLEIKLYDKVINTEITLYFTIFDTYSVIAWHASFTNLLNTQITLQSAMNMNIDLTDHDFEMIELTGAWSRERHIKN